MSVQLIDEPCPECGVTCWANNGDTNDLTAPDVDAMRCWKCGHEWLLEGAEDWTTLEDAEPEDTYATAKEALG